MEGEFNLMEAANELIAEGETGGTSAESTQTEGQSEANPAQTASEEAISPADILKQVGEEKPAELDQDFLAKLNALGAIHNGLPVKVNTPEEAKELMMKGFDYTKKTMAHAEEVRVKQEEFSKLEAQFKEKETAIAQKEQEVQSVVIENNLIGNLLARWKTEDPELFNYISQAWQKEVSTFQQQQPIIAQYENRLKEIDGRFAQLEKGKQAEELGSIKQSWEKELSEVQTNVAAPLAKLGVVPDWDKVKEAWSADSTNKMTVEQALYAVHGKDIAKANESRQKLLATKNKTQSTMLGRSGVGAGQKGAQETIKAIRPGDYQSILRQGLEQI